MSDEAGKIGLNRTQGTALGVGENSGASKPVSREQQYIRTADDASSKQSGMSESVQTDTRAYSDAMQGVNSGISLMNVTEEAVGSLQDITEQQKNLAEKSANQSYSDEERAAFDAEIDKLTTEYNRVVSSASLNEQNLIDGSTEQAEVRVGSNAEDVVSVSSLGDLSSEELDISSASAAESVITGLSSRSTELEGKMQVIDSGKQTFSSAAESLQTKKKELDPEYAKIEDVQEAENVTNNVREQIVKEAGPAVEAHSGLQSQRVLDLLKGA